MTDPPAVEEAREAAWNAIIAVGELPEDDPTLAVEAEDSADALDALIEAVRREGREKFDGAMLLATAECAGCIRYRTALEEIVELASSMPRWCARLNA